MQAAGEAKLVLNQTWVRPLASRRPFLATRLERGQNPARHTNNKKSHHARHTKLNSLGHSAFRSWSQLKSEAPESTELLLGGAVGAGTCSKEIRVDVEPFKGKPCHHFQAGKDVTKSV